MNLQEMLTAARARLAAALDRRAASTARIHEMRAKLQDNDSTVNRLDVDAVIAERTVIDVDINNINAEIASIEAEIQRDAEIDELSRRSSAAAARPTYDNVGRVVSEARTYAAQRERGYLNERDGRAIFRAGAKPGAQFERDVLSAYMGDYEARDRLMRHQAEERVERSQYLQRAVGTTAFAGLTVPQYLTDLYAPAASAGRPFADAIAGGPGAHLLPEQGMTVEISRITTSTSAALQSSQNASVSETNADDTQLSIAVQTAAGQQTVSRQALERSTGVEPIALDDLFRRVGANLDSTLINQASTGLTNVATSVTYTDASPTAAELYPRFQEAMAGVEGALLDQSTGEMIAIMNSRRWRWMQSQVGTSRPFVGQPGISAEQGAMNYAVAYGRGYRGLLPDGTPVIVDNNVATNLGTGTNEDEIYVGDRGEFHLWEDPSAPMFIRAEQPAAASLGVLLVVYSYFAYTHARQTHSRKIVGTGLVTPTWTGA